MNLKEYIQSFEPKHRRKARFDLAIQVGVSVHTINAYSQNKRTPKYPMINKLVQASNVKMTKKDLLLQFFGED